MAIVFGISSKMIRILQSGIYQMDCRVGHNESIVWKNRRNRKCQNAPPFWNVPCILAPQGRHDWAVPPPLRGEFGGGVFRWLAPPANFHRPSGPRTLQNRQSALSRVGGPITLQKSPKCASFGEHSCPAALVSATLARHASSFVECSLHSCPGGALEISRWRKPPVSDRIASRPGGAAEHCSRKFATPRNCDTIYVFDPSQLALPSGFRNQGTGSTDCSGLAGTIARLSWRRSRRDGCGALHYWWRR